MAADPGPRPVLVYDRIASNRRRAWLFLFLGTVLSLPSVALWLPYAVFFAFVIALPIVAGLGAGDGATLAIAAGVAVFSVTLVPFLVYANARKVALRVAGAVPLAHTDTPAIHRAAANLAIAAGLPPPTLYVIESPAANALSLGVNPRTAAVVATRGLLELLEPTEIEAVIAHELSHIISEDTRLGTVIAAQVSLLWLPWRIGRRIVVGGFRLAVRIHPIVAAGCGFYLFLVAASMVAGFAMVGELGATFALLQVAGCAVFAYTLFGAPVAVALVGRATWREREHIADAGAFLLTRRPDTLARALARLEAAPGGEALRSAALAHLWLVPPAPPGRHRGSLQATHPPTADRIARIAGMAGGAPGAVLAEAERAARAHRASR